MTMEDLVLFIPGMWGNQATVEVALNEIAPPGVRTMALTLPGHAYFDPKDRALASASISEYRAYVVREVRQLSQHYRLIIVGHSMGGLLAMMAAEEGLAHALVLLAPGAPKGVGNLSPTLLPLIASVTVHQIWSVIPWSRPHVPGPWVASYTLLGTLTPEVKQRVIADLVGESLRALNENLSAPAVAWLTLAPCTPHPRRVDLSKVRCPVFLVFGSKDRITPPKIGDQLMAKFPSNPKSVHILVKDACHWIFEEPSWKSDPENEEALHTRIRAWIAARLKER
jgi:pimeloyl-ACP methyl ester carboxylesterase